MCMTSNAWTPLHSASQYGKLDVIKYLIKEQQCDPNCRTLNGITPLHLACRHQHFETVVYLVNECIGDGLSSLTNYGESLLEEALNSGIDDILFFLVSRGLQFTSKILKLKAILDLYNQLLKCLYWEMQCLVKVLLSRPSYPILLRVVGSVRSLAPRSLEWSLTLPELFLTMLKVKAVVDLSYMILLVSVNTIHQAMLPYWKILSVLRMI